ncbi:MAG: hypothetical protein DMF97_18245 [Acidobacteria bacterium]|nr:MAG: hypothetical protein DMF97_18245 [Acidobacteriota bacterium]
MSEQEAVVGLVVSSRQHQVGAVSSVDGDLDRRAFTPRDAPVAPRAHCANGNDGFGWRVACEGFFRETIRDVSRLRIADQQRGDDDG